MVESVIIDLDRATDIFEMMRETLIDRYREFGSLSAKLSWVIGEARHSSLAFLGRVCPTGARWAAVSPVDIFFLPGWLLLVGILMDIARKC